MKWICGLPYYTFDEIENNSSKEPIGGSRLAWKKYHMNAQKDLSLHYIGMYLEDHMSGILNLVWAKDRLDKSITHSIDYINEKYCKIT